MSEKKGYAAFNKESSEGMKTLMNVLAWGALFALILITAVHAVSIVLRHHGAGTGVLYWLRVAAPIMTEVFTALVTLGFALHVWRGVQRWLGLAVEIIWILFASLNLISDFTMEGGGAAGGMIGYWIAYGLPVSAVITGVLFYFTLRSSPENKRIEAEKAAAAQRTEDDFDARQQVLGSAEFETIRRRRAWLEIVNDLKRQGYDDDEIGFMIQRTPQLAGYHSTALPATTTTVVEGQAEESPRPSWGDRVRRRLTPADSPPRPAPQEAAPDDAVLAYIRQNPHILAELSLARPADDVGNSTHSAPHHDAGHAGQGDGNGAPPPVLGRDTHRPL